MPTARRHAPKSGPAALAVIAALAAFSPVSAETPRLALMPVKFLDTSHEARDQSADHTARQGYFAAAVAKGGAALTLDAAEVAAACPVETPRCLVDFARAQGADAAVFVVVHKSSTLIMQAFVQRLDLRTETVTGKWDINFRGDTDDSWRRAGRYLGGLLAE